MKKLNYFLSSALLAVILFASASVMGQNPFYVNVLQPNDGVNHIEWVVGEDHLISWDDNLSQPVNIYLVNATLAAPLPAGVLLNTVAPVSGGTWTWETPNTTYAEDANYQIRVQSSISPLTYNNTGAIFSLVQATTDPITILQPTVANISWAKGTTHLVSWEDNFNENVEVWLFKDGASLVELTPAGVGVTGTTWEWTISDALDADDDYTIRVQSTDFSNEYSESAVAFSLTDASGDVYEIYQPNALSDWKMGNQYLISWRDDLTEAVNIYYQKSTGSQTLITGGGNVTGSTFLWTVPTTSGFEGDYIIIVESTEDITIEATSAAFTISKTVGSISVIEQPLTDASWTVGTTHLISWLDNLTETVNVYYTFDGGTTLLDVELDVTGTTCYWTVPTGTTGVDVCRIVVKSTDDGLVKTMSEAFDLTLSSGTDIEVLQPSIAGLNWAYNTTHLISWNDNFPENVQIQLVSYTNAAGTAGEIVLNTDIITSVASSTYIWDIDAIFPASGGVSGLDPDLFYRVIIRSVDDNSIVDSSDYTFTINATAGTYVTVLQPNGGEYWMAGTSHLISWIDDLPENVYINLYKAGVKVSEGSSGLLDATTYSGSTMTWNIPVGLTAASDYTIVITSVLDASITDDSNADFDIVPFGKSANSNSIFNVDLVSVYPNPANGNVNVFAPVAITQVEIRNMLGQVIYTNDIGTEKVSIDISTYDAGLYIVNVIIEGNVVTKKLFVQ